MEEEIKVGDEGWKETEVGKSRTQGGREETNRQWKNQSHWRGDVGKGGDKKREGRKRQRGKEGEEKTPTAIWNVALKYSWYSPDQTGENQFLSTWLLTFAPLSSPLLSSPLLLCPSFPASFSPPFLRHLLASHTINWLQCHLSPRLLNAFP